MPDGAPHPKPREGGVHAEAARAQGPDAATAQAPEGARRDGAAQAQLPARAADGAADAGVQDRPAPRQAAALTGEAPLGPPPGFIRQFELVERVKAYDPEADEALLNQAYVFAMRAHGDQKRSSGDPYFTHPLSVAAILTDLRLDPASIATALLHDVAEDTEVGIDDIRAAFGEEVAGLVDGVTKISTRELAADADGKAESFAKFILATAKDVRVLLVKLADRLHNMRTLDYVPPAKRERVARETMEIYAPLAGRMGVQRIKEELEDLSFRHLEPEAFEAITEGLERLSAEAVGGVVALSQTIRARLAEASIEAAVTSREKRAFSVWRKMRRKQSLFEELADIYAFRVIVPSTEDCYRALGVIHTAYPMIPGEFDDYVSSPKPNNYQSIHTAVLATGEAGREGQRVEVQIRSAAMHDSAERGIAAHWRYKDAGAKGGRGVVMAQPGRYDAYEWLRGATASLAEGGDAAEFLAQAKMDLYRDQVFPFTPRGRVIPLPKGATGLDFAYALHTDIGDTYAGVKINGVVRPNRTPLRSGDVVEVLRADGAEVPPGWERLVVTGTARGHIRRRIKSLAKREQRALGRKIVTGAFGSRGLPYSEDAVRDAARRMGHRGLKPLLEAAGRLEVTGADVIEQVFPNLGANQDTGPGHAVPLGTVLPGGALALEGLPSGADAKLAACCGPLPGERVVGVPGTHGQGADGVVAVHRIDCAALAEADGDWLDLGWSPREARSFVAAIVVTVNNRTGAIGHIGTMMAKYGADIVDLTLDHREVAFSDMCLDVAVRDARHLASVLTGLRASDYVVEARRREGDEDCGEHDEH